MRTRRRAVVVAGGWGAVRERGAWGGDARRWQEVRVDRGGVDGGHRAGGCSGLRRRHQGARRRGGADAVRGGRGGGEVRLSGQETGGEGGRYRTVGGYGPWAGDLSTRGVGGGVATSPGKTTPYSLFHIQERATLFVGAGVPIYEGQIIGGTRRPNDLNVNAVRPKKLTNVRAAGKDEATVLTPPNPITIESALEWLEEDELLEVTPQSLRLRKRILPANLRKRV